jgi:hypothetical protein
MTMVKYEIITYSYNKSCIKIKNLLINLRIVIFKEKIEI